MDKLIVQGRKRLVGEVNISGAKNAAVAVIPAAIMAEGVSVLENLPRIEDVNNLCHTIEKLGGTCTYLDNGHTLKIDCDKGTAHCATFEEESFLLFPGSDACQIQKSGSCIARRLQLWCQTH